MCQVADIQFLSAIGHAGQRMWPKVQGMHRTRVLRVLGGHVLGHLAYVSRLAAALATPPAPPCPPLHVSLSDAPLVTIQRPPKAASNANNDLINSQDQHYGTNITISGRGKKAFHSIPRYADREFFPVQLSMCSSTQAARICGESDPTLRVARSNGLPSFNDTGLSTTVRYGDGSNFVSGDIGVGAFQLDGCYGY
ncbi:hypothetical protein DFH09DRAFT_1102494 [Mycena vulgaris]|nr:hypothetical protein DFH09DRAFT_1102494 [Mycena vulgaris]